MFCVLGFSGVDIEPQHIANSDDVFGMQSLECGHPLRVETPYPTDSYSSDVPSKVACFGRFSS